ncbi:hypothetical protein V5F49_03690 [Xanthobacter sp. V3C-3]|uniref:hypothetical protein n=1 Tax=Xanthobacter lutulentifluminis TaxID=3119935 RepID=UPI00372C57A5
MYFMETPAVNGLIIVSGNRWLVCLEMSHGLRQMGGIHRSAEAARAALGGS